MTPIENPVQLFLWVVVPYVALAIFVVGHVWRYRHDQFGWTSRSTQLLEGRLLPWGSVLFHYGALAAIGGHVIGLIIPESLTAALGISEELYHVFSAAAGTVAGLACVAGLLILLFRRIGNRRVRRYTTRVDVVVLILLLGIIALGLTETIGFNVIGGSYDYRVTVGIWFRGIFLLEPAPALMASAPLVYQIHALAAWLLYALWPFSRLVHVWSYPIQYLGRPYILYRRRYASGYR